jgi:hypothetical protein
VERDKLNKSESIASPRNMSDKLLTEERKKERKKEEE